MTCKTTRNYMTVHNALPSDGESRGNIYKPPYKAVRVYKTRPDETERQPVCQPSFFFFLI